MPRLLIHETGVHYIDTFRYLFGTPTAVHADLRRCNPVIAGEDGVEEGFAQNLLRPMECGGDMGTLAITAQGIRLI